MRKIGSQPSTRQSGPKPAGRAAGSISAAVRRSAAAIACAAWRPSAALPARTATVRLAPRSNRAASRRASKRSESGSEPAEPSGSSTPGRCGVAPARARQSASGRRSGALGQRQCRLADLEDAERHRAAADQPDQGAVGERRQHLGEQAEAGARAGDRQLEMGDRAADQRIVLDGARQGDRHQLEPGQAEVARQRDEAAVLGGRCGEAGVELLEGLRVPGREESLFRLGGLGLGDGQRPGQQGERHGAQAGRARSRMRVRPHGRPS